MLGCKAGCYCSYQAIPAGHVGLHVPVDAVRVPPVQCSDHSQARVSGVWYNFRPVNVNSHMLQALPSLQPSLTFPPGSALHQLHVSMDLLIQTLWAPVSDS